MEGQAEALPPAQENPSEPEPGTDPPQADWSGEGERPAKGYGESEAGAH